MRNIATSISRWTPYLWEACVIITKKRMNVVIKKGNANIFYEQIKYLNNFLLQEWLKQGKTIEEFKDASAKIVITLDNASFHNRKDILNKIKLEMPNIILEFLPPYTLDYKLIELVWHSAKEYIAHRFFESVSQLEKLLNKLLNEGVLLLNVSARLKTKVMLFIKFSCVTAYLSKDIIRIYLSSPNFGFSHRST